MNDDWRLQIDFVADGPADALHDRLDAQELGHGLSDAFHDRVVVSRDGTTLFLYAGDREQAEKARDLVQRITAEDEEGVTVDFKRWHPTAEEWRSPEEPLPGDDAEKQGEREEAVARELKETEERGYPEFEVRIDLPSRHEAIAFADRLRGEGLPAVHRWKYVLIGAVDEEQAKELADRIRDEAPVGSKVAAEGTWQASYGERPRSPFAFLGGLAE